MDAAKERLKQLYRLDLKIKRYEAQLEDIKQRMYSISSPAFDHDRVMFSSNADDQIVKLIGRTAQISSMITAQKNRAAILYEQILAEIDRMEDERLKTILVDRYVRYMTWEQVADDIKYEISYITKHLHRMALTEYARVNGL